MTVTEIITILENRLTTLQSARVDAVAQGAMDNISTLDADIASTTTSLESLKALV
jgi:hypothetical protein